ncbi:DEAD/DEAH box helicase [Ornithinimicrobium sp. LYQ121]|uniref:DEAD/DEAH box helicase n=1 Tax=Ornithinimicrobium sp. LYQ121 TaxID=3378801 RepID=UPI003855221D
MADQDELTPGALVTGVVDGEAVRVVSVRVSGDSALVSFERGSGERGSAFLSRDQLLGVIPAQRSVTWDAPWSDVQLGLQALAITAAPHEGWLLAVSSSNVTPLPHQVQAVYHEMLPHERLRFLLADDPGAGKTIMTGLYLKEILARQRAARVLIVAPGSLSEQWVDEMWGRFGLAFVELGMEHLDRHDPARPTVGPAGPLVVARLDQLSRNLELRDAVLTSGFDIVVVDEAHKMSARDWGSRTFFSKRYQLGQELAAQTPNLLLLTATPHNGKPADFQHFMRLLGVELDPDTPVLEQAPVRRLVKEQLVHADGSRLFPPRVASTLTYTMAGSERVLYEAVTEYVADEMNKVMDDSVRRHVGFAMMVLQRRLASSPEAILRSLERRLDLLRNQLELAREAEEDLGRLLAASLAGGSVPEDNDDDEVDDGATSDATSARTPGELHTEILVLERLVGRARLVRDEGVDRKWDALAGLLTSPDMVDPSGLRRKIIVFTEHRDTLDYLEERLGEVLRPGERVAVISGLTARHDRRQAQHDFRHDPNCSVLLATDAAGEGVNLQVANLMVNYDIPWNPNRLEQRFGRIHRIGQDRTCHLWNLVAADTREGAVFETLLGKLQVQRDALGDRVFDVLGDVLSGADLSKILTDAVRGGGEAGLAVLEKRLDRGLAEEVARRAASTTEFTPEDLELVQRQLVWAEAFDPQVATVPEFALRALRQYGAEVHEVGPALWAVPYVPAILADAPGVERHYWRLHLDRAGLAADDAGAGQFLAPGHPLLTALTRRVLEDLRDPLRDGVILEDSRSAVDYLLVTTLEEGYPQTWRYDVGGGRVEVAVDAALRLHPLADADTGWASELADLLGVADDSRVAVVAVRGAGAAAEVRGRQQELEELAGRLATEGVVVRGRQGDGFDLAVERGPEVKFVTVE